MIRILIPLDTIFNGIFPFFDDGNKHINREIATQIWVFTAFWDAP